MQASVPAFSSRAATFWKRLGSLWSLAFFTPHFVTRPGTGWSFERALDPFRPPRVPCACYACYPNMLSWSSPPWSERWRGKSAHRCITRMTGTASMAGIKLPLLPLRLPSSFRVSFSSSSHPALPSKQKQRYLFCSFDFVIFPNQSLHLYRKQWRLLRLIRLSSRPLLSM